LHIDEIRTKTENFFPVSDPQPAHATAGNDPSIGPDFKTPLVVEADFRPSDKMKWIRRSADLLFGRNAAGF